MIVAGVVIQTIPQQAAAVAGRLATVPGLKLLDHDDDHRIAAVWEGENGETLEALGEELVASDEAVLGIHPTFAGRSSDNGQQPIPSQRLRPTAASEKPTFAGEDDEG